MLPTIIYCATRSEDIKFAEISANSVKNIYPEIDIVLYTNSSDFSSRYFTEINLLDNAQIDFSDKILSLLQTDRQDILFLDCDTYLLKPIDELFLLLNRFDLSVSHSIINESINVNGLPSSFPELNTGVILLRKNKPITEFISLWYRLYYTLKEKHESYHDQPSFRLALYYSQVKFYIFKPEYNCRFNIGALISEDIKLLHGKSSDLKKTANKIDQLYNDMPIKSHYLKYIKYTFINNLKHKLIRALHRYLSF